MALSTVASRTPLLSDASSSSLSEEWPFEITNRVLIYTTCYNVIDGVTLTIRKIEQAILASGGHVCILTTKSGNEANTNLDGTHPNRQVLFMDNSIPIPFLHDPNNPDASYHLGFSLSKSMMKKVDDFAPTIIHITVTDCVGLSMIKYARDKQLPLMGTYHSNIVEYMDHYPGMGWLKPLLASFFRHQYNFLQALYVPTPYIRNYLVEEYKYDRITNLGIWGRGIDLELFSPAHRSQIFRQKLGIRDDEVVITFVGRLVPEKRPDIVASVVRRLAARNLPFHALIIGAGPCEDEMESLPKTTCTGWMTREELTVAYASSDIFLFPSAVETFGNVTLEAAASGLPLVVEAGCSGHLVQEGVNGYACSAADEDAFFEGTLELVVNEQRREHYSKQSRKLSQRYEKQLVLNQMIQNYNRVTEQFYGEYSGSHQKRDEAFMNEDSFIGGQDPRPFGIILSQSFVVLAFQFIWFLMSGYVWFHSNVITPSLVWMQERFALPALHHRIPFEAESNAVVVAVAVPATSLSQVVYKKGIDSRGEFNNEDEESVSTTQTGAASLVAPPPVSDTDSDTDDSSTAHFSVVSMCANSAARFGDGAIARSAVELFVWANLMSFRFTNCLSRSLRRLLPSTASYETSEKYIGPKRKNSNVFYRPTGYRASADGDTSGECVGIRSREEELERRGSRRVS